MTGRAEGLWGSVVWWSSWFDVTRLFAWFFGPEWIPALAVMAVGFVAGVGYSAYRALGWVEGIRSWARMVPLDQDRTVAGASVDEKGWN